ncbi:MAG: hypothetical protein NWF04_10510 [Candidatus Bathyarchaeota archaeon]|nr:hypothetical protein [Candidatus Bathyarchaeota archaeon]
MQINKKVFSTATMALLLLSVVAVATPASALTGDEALYPVNVITGAIGAQTNSSIVNSRMLINGTGATGGGPVQIYFDSISTANLLNQTTANAAGTYSAQITIPSATNGVHTIYVYDTIAGATENTVLVVNASLRLSTSKALPGDSITLTGHGFTANSAVTSTIYNGTHTFTLSTTGSTNSTGSVTQTVVIPNLALSTTPYTVNMTDAAGVNVTTTITINYYLTVSPSSGPPSIDITINGRIPPNTLANIQIDGVNIGQSTSAADGTLTFDYTLPDLIGAGNRTIHAVWGVTNYVEAFFFVTAPPSAPVLSAANGQAGVVIGITNGTNVFTANANITLTIGTTEVNSTATDARFGPTDMYGAFDTEFSVPNITPGTYTLTITDENGASSSTTFTVSPTPATTITLNSNSYVQGDRLSFTIYTTESSLGTINVTIRDPSGNVWWTAIWALTANPDSSQSVRYQNQTVPASNGAVTGNPIVLPNDAPLGSWNWTVAYTPASTGVAAKATNLFAVGLGGTGGVVNAVNDLEGMLVDISGDIATVMTDIGEVQGTVTSIKNSVATINIPDLGTITTTLASIDAVLGDVAGRVVTIETSVGSFETTLDSINTKVTGLNGDIATIKTDLGSLQGTVTSISGNVATIQTDIGTLEADISGLQSEVSDTQNNVSGIPTLVYVAIVLALIAAIAAIASIILMRQKIAG